MSKLGVNIDHVATLRNARGENHPNILKFADIAINSGADSITVHLREDRRHIKDLDLKKLCKKKIKINLEMACNNKMLKIALRNMPNYVCIVPEKRKEITRPPGETCRLNISTCYIIKGRFHVVKPPQGIQSFHAADLVQPSKNGYLHLEGYS